MQTFPARSPESPDRGNGWRPPCGRENVSHGDVDPFAVSAELRNRFAANVPGGPGQLRARLGLKPGLDRLMFHGATKHRDQARVLVQMKDDAHGCISDWTQPR